MLGIQDLPLFIAAGLLLNLTPGQDTIFIISRSTDGGLRAGVAARVKFPIEPPCGLTLRPPNRGAVCRAFRQGCLTNMLNPKVALFFLAFLPQFVSRDAANPALAMAVLGLIFCFNGTLWCLFVAWPTAQLTHRVTPDARLAALLEGFGGSLMLWLAANLALAEAR